MRRIVAGIVFAIAVSAIGAWSTASMAGAPPHDCLPPTDKTYGPGMVAVTYDYATVYPGGYKGQACGDATRGMLLYRSDEAPLGRAYGCDACHKNVLDDLSGNPSERPILMRGAPRNPQYIAEKLPDAPGAGITWLLMAQPTCRTEDPAVHCLSDRTPGNVMGDIGDISEFLHTCNLGIAPCVTGGGGGGGGSQGELQGSGTMNFGGQPAGSTSAPLTLTLSNIGAGTVNVSSVTSDNAAEFAITANTCTSLTQATSCTVKVTFRPSAMGARSGGIIVTSNGLYSPQKFTFTGTGTAAAGVNYGGIWWNAPANSESGWGINFDHQGNTIFATWFTYDATGKAWWLVMTAEKGTGNTYTGTLYKTTGSGYDAATFTAGTPVEAGTGTLTFTDANNATLDYNVTGFPPKTKSLTRQVFGTLPSCTYSTAPNFAAAANYQGLWWLAAESGWGINFAHQGNTIFASWFTFDTDGSPLWLVATMQKGPGETFTGKLYRMTATPFGATPFAANTPVEVGSATLSFANGNSATFGYTIGAVSRTKTITRQLFAPPAGTLCN